MTVKRLEVIAESVRKVKASVVKVDTANLIGGEVDTIW
jgi:hypothetical protein